MTAAAGQHEDRVRRLAEASAWRVRLAEHDLETSEAFEAWIADPDNEIFFDSATTQMRPALLEKAVAAGKHIYCEKPISTNLAEALKISK